MTGFEGPFLAVDWGTTNRRVFRIEGGAVKATERDAHGVVNVAPGGFEDEVMGIRARLGQLPMLLAGMVGSTLGWRDASYLTVPVGLAALAGGLRRIDARTFIVPGVSVLTDSRADVMRGEEIQLLGAVTARLVPRDALLCQPGTHCKWALVAGGAIVDFTTAMTGELFAMLRNYGLLAAELRAEVTPGAAFREGVAAGRSGDLAAALFGIRAAKLLRRRDDADAASFASGLLIGNDVSARLAAYGSEVYILAEPGLAELYWIAVDANDGTAHVVDSQAAFVAGINALARMIA